MIIYISVNWLIIGSGNGFLSICLQAQPYTNAHVLSTVTQVKNFTEILIKYKFSFKKIHFKMPSAKWQIFCSGFMC